MTTAKLDLKRGDYAAAEKALIKETQKNPQNGEAWFFLGECQYQGAKYADMINSFENSLKVDNSHEKEITFDKRNAWIVLMKLGGTYVDSSTKQKDKATFYANKALESYQLAIKCVPDNPITFQNLAITYAHLNNGPERIKALEQARSLSKTDSTKTEITNDIIDYYFTTGDKLAAAGDTAAATPFYNSAFDEISGLRKSNPDDKKLLMALIDIDNKLGKQTEAMELVKTLVQQDPKDKTYQNYLGYLYSKANNYDDAIKHLEAALAVDSNYIEALNNAGLIYDRLGQKMRTESQASTAKNPDKSYLEKFKMCAKYFQRLSVLKSTDPNIWDALASAYVNAGLIPDAKKAMAQADALRKQPNK